MARPTHREFFAVRTVSQALAGFRPQRRTSVEMVALERAHRRVPATAVRAPHDLPGFARSTVDGFAVRAADTYGASEGLPSYLEITGAVAMGRPPEIAVEAGTAASIPTGAAIPDGADAVVMVEYTQEAMPGTIEVVRPVAPGDGLVRGDEDASAGAELLPAGRPLRAQDLGLLAATGLTEVGVRARPRVAIVSTGDEVVPPSTPEPAFGQVRDATAVALAALVCDAGGEPDVRGIVPDDYDALDHALREAVGSCDVIVVSAGSSVGSRDETAAVVAGLGRPGIWTHGIAVRPGKPTLLADCDGVPVIGLPGNPRSALVVFRLIGMPIVRLVGGATHPVQEPGVRARLDRDVPSSAGRLDVVQVVLRGGVASPLFGASALLTVLTRADGYIIVDEDATGLPSGSDVDVTLYR
ncbi:molybdopterin-binding protein [Capillimicrobium parvum]|uniref:Molybdopterin molybdenumtransferase n=1 Tax=Capillimicrobium parvum TaxID=2884022 RepID=A0A9E6XVX7_9ACTN|nr:gephyrin-like molybdotransferase Glp [Capillimicrobium parvum]UGS34762.1 Molybdopterin molybdenumtransferase [Capillimicrobium parvum]